MVGWVTSLATTSTPRPLVGMSSKFCGHYIIFHSASITLTSYCMRWRLKSPAVRLFTQPFILAFVRGIHRSPVNSPHTLPVRRKMFPFDDVIMPNNYVHGSGTCRCYQFVQGCFTTTLAIIWTTKRRWFNHSRTKHGITEWMFIDIIFILETRASTLCILLKSLSYSLLYIWCGFGTNRNLPLTLL